MQLHGERTQNSGITTDTTQHNNILEMDTDILYIFGEGEVELEEKELSDIRSGNRSQQLRQEKVSTHKFEDSKCVSPPLFFVSLCLSLSPGSCRVSMTQLRVP